MKNNNHIPWVEKYRPNNFKDIVLSENNKIILENMLVDNFFPNLLLFGPPGTGKTTTIINLINNYQEKNNEKNKGLMIHLNASDERGIDIIRNNIYNFVNSKNLFNEGTKFIILDEVDYMTKNAQQALKYLLDINKKNVRFCLICNYISKIDESLQTEFMKLAFSQLPKYKIIEFIRNINVQENLNFSENDLNIIQELYNSDIRSMINYMQSNQNSLIKKNIINNEIWQELVNNINNKLNNINYFINYINNISIEYKIEIKFIIKSFITFIIKNYNISINFLNDIEMIIHQTENLNNYNLKFLYYSIQSLQPLEIL